VPIHGGVAVLNGSHLGPPGGWWNQRRTNFINTIRWLGVNQASANLSSNERRL
jgi:hypothetical protein